MTTTPANPENVPLDKIPAGWRLLYEEEYGNEKLVPTRQWLFSSEKFSAICDPTESRRPRYTYITTDLPDNGQPWHAHRPGDPAPVAYGVKVDAVARNGWTWNGAVWGGSDPDSELAVIFYRLHEPATKQTTFEAHGHTWFKHTPGDPMPCDGEAEVLCTGGAGLSQEVHRASWWDWSELTCVTGWRYATSEPTVKPHNPHISDRILELLIVAGHVTPEKVEQARKLAQP